tara:strand:+ start:26520 stop:27023 length:504 start_codon:yes stop_codon:yes gene_type:complete
MAMNGTTLRILSMTLVFILACAPGHSMERRGRLGVGFSNQFVTQIPALSFKIQRSRSFSFGGMLGLNTDSQDGGFGAGLKLYRILFDEPQLNFYSSILGAYIKDSDGNRDSRSGFQFDVTLGTEFSFVGLQSLGFSLDFGLSMHKLDEFVIETTTSGLVVAAVHFYL